MKAVTYHKYGGPEVLEMADLSNPVPKSNEVLIKVFATTVSSGDWRARSLVLPRGMGFLGRPVFGFFGPRQPVLGTELAGVIEAVGNEVTKFNVGDQVFAFSGAKFGCHAEYKTMPQGGPLALKPSNLSFEQAAALSFGGTTALDFLRDKGKIRQGEKVLVIGASGAVGTAAVQIAKYFGAKVTGVCSTPNLELVESLGADHVVDYTKGDFTQTKKKYDIIFEASGSTRWATAKKLLTAQGRMLLVNGSLPDMLRSAFMGKRIGKKLIGGVAAERVEDLRTLAELAQTGDFLPVIDRAYAFDQFVQAHTHVDTGRKRGSVVLTVLPEPVRRRTAI